MFPISLQSIYQKIALLLFCHTKYLFHSKWYWLLTWNNFPIVFQDPLRHFVDLPSWSTNHLTKILPIQRKCLSTVAKITPIVPLKPTYIGNVTFISSHLSMFVGSMLLKYISLCHADDIRKSLHKIVPKIDWIDSFIYFLTVSFIKLAYNSALLYHCVTSSKILRILPISLHNFCRSLDAFSPNVSKIIASGAPISLAIF